MHSLHYQQLHAINAKMGRLRSMAYAVSQSPMLTLAQKRARLDDINGMRSKMLERAAPMLERVACLH